MKHYISRILANLIFLVLMLLPAAGYAQLGDPEGDPDAPVDGGLITLVAAGVGYGIKKAVDNRKNGRASK
ncbi:MAG TPA: hypothetical protein PKC39_09960 [Ferruginibacter sp.]|nr:hypothetical protein [Ferruginibacter sp.]HMP21273.1 hypothetical protein [Ferruginibacter sp.]